MRAHLEVSPLPVEGLEGFNALYGSLAAQDWPVCAVGATQP